MGTAEVWMGNDAWPNNQSCKNFAEDVFRISGAKTDKEKALAFYDWFTRCMMRGANLMSPDGGGGYSRNYDALTLLTSWGHGECTFWGWVATECLMSAGLKTRRVVVHNQGHTYYEVFYKGDDGVEQWHAFDPFGGWYYLNESGEVASCEQLANNPQLVQNPLPGHPEPLGHHPDRASLGHRHRTEDQIFIDQPIRNKKNIWKLKPGMQVVMNFLPQSPYLGLFIDSGSTNGHRKYGPHDDMAEDSRLGFKQHQNHMPYWKNYMWKSSVTGGLNEGRPVRWNGEGALRWKPLQQDLSNACEVHNAVIKNGALSPSGTHEFMEVWYHIELPYMASYIMADYDVVGAGGDFFGLCISADNRQSWWPIVGSNSPHYGTCTNGQKQWLDKKSSVQGLREFWLRIDMVTHQENISLAMQALNLTIGFQHNMHVQPRLLPGKNDLWLNNEKNSDGVNVTAEWVYQKDGKQYIESLENSKEGKVEGSLSLDGACPTEIKMSSVRLIAK